MYTAHSLRVGAKETCKHGARNQRPFKFIYLNILTTRSEVKSLENFEIFHSKSTTEISVGKPLTL